MNPVLMQENSLTALLISDDATDARQIQKALSDVSGDNWLLEQVGRLSDGVKRLREKAIAVVLLDLFLPDSQGMKTFKLLFEAAPLVPIVVLTDRENEVLAWQTTRLGAENHVLKDDLDGFGLPRILDSAIERKQAEEAYFVK